MLCLYRLVCRIYRFRLNLIDQRASMSEHTFSRMYSMAAGIARAGCSSELCLTAILPSSVHAIVPSRSSHFRQFQSFQILRSKHDEEAESQHSTNLPGIDLAFRTMASHLLVPRHDRPCQCSIILRNVRTILQGSA